VSSKSVVLNFDLDWRGAAGLWSPLNRKSNKNVLDLRSFGVNILPEDGTLVPKHVGVGT
jgi:hypothetical protein